MEDTRLLRLLHRDPNRGMEQLLHQYTGLVYAVVKGKLVGSHCVSSDIEECVADVFSEFYMELSKFDPAKSSIKTYLCVMARNNAIDFLRKQDKRRGEQSLDNEKQCVFHQDDFAIESELEEEELRREVFEAIKSLGHPDCDIILGKYYYGESSKELAKSLNLTVANVDTRTHRALNRLRKLFGGDDV